MMPLLRHLLSGWITCCCCLVACQIGTAKHRRHTTRTLENSTTERNTYSVCS
ncbi:hypothetical protein M758_7G028300 [Ceratodon purpureus]|uniref:Uncharacterized protein n=1 Tax=Ceratodon purpureus TaxID=3225 RepID=A0A8T0H430_CERPU|nr:hypothetical protein KC19_7G029700 [Ceratodon purpureus]KAG0609968.1 hypothetical protein M758_7G028300 [Ceratodon purpureus]